MANTVKYANNIKLRSIDLPRIDTRDKELKTPGLLLPNGGGDSGGPLVDGEVLIVESQGESPTYKLIRATNKSVEKAYADPTKYGEIFIVLAGAQRSDTMTTQKASVFMGNKQGLMFDTNVVLAGTYHVDDALTLGEVTVNDPTGSNKVKSGWVPVSDSARPLAYVDEVLRDGWIKVRLAV